MIRKAPRQAMRESGLETDQKATDREGIPKFAGTEGTYNTGEFVRGECREVWMKWFWKFAGDKEGESHGKMSGDVEYS